MEGTRAETHAPNAIYKKKKKKNVRGSIDDDDDDVLREHFHEVTYLGIKVLLGTSSFLIYIHMYIYL